MKACDCNAVFSNTGTDCTTLLDVAYKLIPVPLFDADGNRNKIAFTDTLNAAYFSALINNADKNLRWYVTPEIKNVEDVRAASTTETFEDNSKVKIQHGVRTFKAWFVNGTQQLKGALDSFACRPVGVYIIDKAGNLIGTIGGDQDECDPAYLYPIRLEEGSIDAIFVKKTDKTSQKVELNFEFHMDEDDANLRVITQEEAGTNLKDLRGLLDVCSIITNISQTGFTAQLRVMGYGTPINPITVDGLVSGDFALYNVTDTASVTISSVTENPDGTYAFVFASQDIGDELRLTPTKTGYDFAEVVANLIEIPTT